MHTLSRLRSWSLQSSCCRHLQLPSYDSRVCQPASIVRPSKPGLAVQFSTLGQPQTNDFGFRELGIRRPIARALRRAFPAVETPTLCQAEFIPAILDGRDVLLHDRTGTGKSFGIILALLSKYPEEDFDPARKETVAERGIQSLVVVPHRDLAYQMLHWIRAIVQYSPRHAAVAFEGIVQAVYRGASNPIESQALSVSKNPPRILIGTPQALLDIYNNYPSALNINTLSTLVVDEVDYLLGVPSSQIRKSHHDKAWKNFRRHPSPARVLVGKILAARKPGARSGLETDISGGRDIAHNINSPGSPATVTPHIQVVICSATVQDSLKGFVTEKTGWLGGVEGGDDFILVAGPRVNKKHSILEQWAAPHSIVTHHALVVSRSGQITNMEGALKINEVEDNSTESEGAQRHVSRSIVSNSPTAEGDFTREHEGNKASWFQPPELEDVSGRYETQPYSASMMEAIATYFALKVPSVALLVLPPASPVQRVVQELRDLGVNAQGLDLQSDTSGRTHLLRDFKTETMDSPTLLVSVPAATRGIDIPELSHVFLIGIPDVADADVYEHIAGRVGRFGRGGKVISFLKGREVELKDGMMKTKVNEPGLMGIIYRRIGIRPVWLNVDIFDSEAE